jgi:ADP-heptose:LPS heptosyltransferase
MKAIAYFRNGIGNFVMMMPALQAVASMVGSKKVDLCIDPGWMDPRRPSVETIAREWPVIGEMTIPFSGKSLKNGYRLWYYSSHGEQGDFAHTFMSRVKSPPPRPSWRRDGIHEADFYMGVARMLGYRGEVPKVEFPLADSPILDLPRPIIGLCNGAFMTQSREWDKKHWPHYAKLAQVLKRRFGGSVVGVGSGNEMAGVPLDENFCGKLSITQTARVISQLDSFVSTDTANMHIADALGVKMVALFGPTLATKNRPRGERSKVLQSGVQCAPCQDAPGFMHCSIYRCMKSISVGDVVASVEGQINGQQG